MTGRKPDWDLFANASDDVLIDSADIGVDRRGQRRIVIPLRILERAGWARQTKGFDVILALDAPGRIRVAKREGLEAWSNDQIAEMASIASSSGLEARASLQLSFLRSRILPNENRLQLPKVAMTHLASGRGLPSSVYLISEEGVLEIWSSEAKEILLSRIQDEGIDIPRI